VAQKALGGNPQQLFKVLAPPKRKEKPSPTAQAPPAKRTAESCLLTITTNNSSSAIRDLGVGGKKEGK
jgi:hypothetical protein